MLSGTKRKSAFARKKRNRRNSHRRHSYRRSVQTIRWIAVRRPAHEKGGNRISLDWLSYKKRSVQSPRRWGWGIPLEKTTATEHRECVKPRDIVQDFSRMA